MEYFNALGNSIKRVKNKEFVETVAVDGFSLYTDDKIKYYDYIPVNYPFTVVYTIETKSNNTAFIPEWNPIAYFQVGVQSSLYSITIPNDIGFNTSSSQFDKYQVIEKKNENSLTFSLSNVPSIKHEPLCPSIDKITPNLKIGLHRFHLAGVDGEADSWEEFGEWMFHALLKSRNNLSEETRQKINNLVSHTSDLKERAKIIYEYVQNKTRYVNVSIGIGGWMPMETDDVDKLS